MADAEAEQPPVAVAEGDVPPGEELPPPEVKPEEGMDSGADRFAYWKTYPGIWKILQFIFFVIALICVIICLTPSQSQHERPCYTMRNVTYDSNLKTGFFLIMDHVYNKETDGVTTNPYYTGDTPVDHCYNSLTYPEGAWGMGRHDIWLYAWAVLIVGGFGANITIIILQYKNSNFVFNKKNR